MRFFILILFLIIPVINFAQSGFIKAYDFDDLSGVRFTNIALSGDTLIAIGIVTIGEATPQQGLIFAKMDTTGKVINYRLYYDDLGRHYAVGGYPTGFIKLKDNSGYIMLGAIFDTGGGGLIIKLNNKGEIIWRQEYPDSNAFLIRFLQIIELDDGFIIGCTKQSLDYDTDILLIKIDKQGNKQWEQLHGVYNRDERFTKIVVIDDNEFVISCETDNQAINWQNTNYSTKVFAVDSIGGLKWEWESAYSRDEIWIRGLNQDAHGNWVYASAAAEYESDGWRKMQPKLMIRDSQFNLLHEKILDNFDSDDNQFYNLIPAGDDGWLGVGTSGEFLPEPTYYAIGHAYAWMNRMDAIGDTLWERKQLTFPDTLPYATKQILHSVVELPSGSFIGAGYYSLHGPKDYGILMKVDQHGCMDTLACTPTIVHVAAPEEELQLRVYPNPAGNQVSFDFQVPLVHQEATLTIRDLTGRTVYHLENLSDYRTLVWQTATHPNGVYFYQIMTPNATLQSGKIILSK